MIKTMAKGSWREERAYLFYTVQSQFIIEGISPWRKMLAPHGFLSMLSFMPSRTTCPGVVHLTSQLSLVKKISHGLTYRPV